MKGYKDKQVEAQQIKNSFNSYVTSCLENSLKDAVFLAGRQGGAIYDYQAENAVKFKSPPKYEWGEGVLPYEDDNYDLHYASYGIRKPKFDDKHPAPPLYPYGFTTLTSDPTRYDSSYENTLGNYPPPGPLLPLCDYNGKNAPGTSSDHYNCETYDSQHEFVHNSIQEYMGMFIENKTRQCVKGNIYTNLNSTISFDKMNVSVLFANEKIYADLELNGTISTKDRVFQADLEKYRASVKNRFKLIHELVSHLIEKDVNDVFFDIVRNAHTLDNCRSWGVEGTRCLKDDMSVELIRNACQETDEDCRNADYDNVLMVEDEGSYLFGQPYKFYIAIENRPPALDLVYQQEGKMGFKYDFISFVDGEIVIDPKAYDPDEDFHSGSGYMEKGYDYQMWKEDYDESYNHNYCEQSEEKKEECQNDPFGIATDKLEDINPKNWTNSPMFKDTKRKANVVVEDRDRGGHVLKVRVCDEEGLCDYQNVKIYVGEFDAEQSFNPFTDIEGRFASLEDPYTLAFPEFDYEDEPEEYEFILKGPDDNQLLTKEAEDTFINIPEDSADVAQLDTLKEKVREVFEEGAGEYTLEFQAYDSGGESMLSDTSDTIEVKECLPHSSSEPPYPFTQDDYIYADHACCEGDPSNPDESDWGTFADESTTCYSETQYGCFENFSAPGEIDYSLPSSPPSSFSSEDALKFTLEVKCSGSEGVSCTGDVDGEFDLVEDCSGPCKRCANDSQGCVNVPGGETICDSEFACSLGSGKEYGSGGNHSCQATCSGGECEEATNCKCNMSCGAECEQGLYEWEENTCKYDCGSDCKLGEEDSTTCSVSDDFDFEYTTPGGDVAYVGNSTEGETLTKNANDDDNDYQSVCVHDNYCRFSTCDDGGVSEHKMQKCGPPGKDGKFCYTLPQKCNETGNCTSAVILPFDDNPEGDKCYYNKVCEVDGEDKGWNYDVDQPKPDEAWADGDVCYYGEPWCDEDSGWEQDEDNDKPSDSETSGDSCYYNPHCTVGGWERDEDDSPPDCDSDDPQCTGNGWECPQKEKYKNQLWR